MKIKVKVLKGPEYVVEVSTDMKVTDLKDELCKIIPEYSKDKDKLVFGGRTMADSSSLKDYNISEDSKVHLIIKDLPRNYVDDKQRPEQQEQEVPIEVSDNERIYSSPATNVEKSCNKATDGDANRDAYVDKKNPKVSKECSKFEKILLDKLTKHFKSDEVDKIVGCLQRNIDDDVKRATLNELEHLARHKLKLDD